MVTEEELQEEFTCKRKTGILTVTFYLPSEHYNKTRETRFTGLRRAEEGWRERGGGGGGGLGQHTSPKCFWSTLWPRHVYGDNTNVR